VGRVLRELAGLPPAAPLRNAELMLLDLAPDDQPQAAEPAA
jgi:hypothetical protein